MSSIGQTAARCLAAGNDQRDCGSVIFISQRACYIQFDNAGLICLVRANAGNGPINLVCADSTATDLAFQSIRLGDSVSVGEQRLNTGGQWQYQWSTADVWQRDLPTPGVESSGSSASLNRVLEHSLALRNLAPHDSIISLVACPKRNSSVAKASATGRLDQALQEYTASAAERLEKDMRSVLVGRSRRQRWSSTALERLLGAGLGLTPSGDDLLAGVLLTLNAIDRTDAACTLATAIDPLLGTQTNPISATLLRLAARGLAGERMIKVFHQLNTSASFDVDLAASRLNQIGHTSGWDCLAGFILTLNAARLAAGSTLVNTSGLTHA